MATTETIYNLVPEVPAVVEKQPIYRSKHDPHRPLVGSTFGTHGTTQPLGAAVLTKNDYGFLGKPGEMYRISPAKYLKKGEHCKAPEGNSANPCVKFKYGGPRKEPLPRRDDKPVTGLVSNKSYLTSNAVEAILAVPNRKIKEEVNYLEKEDYGKVPEYLSQVKDEIARENEMIDNFVREQMGLQVETTERLEEVTEEERTHLVNSLKAKWDDVNKRYQLMAHMVDLDTIGQLQRKEQMEKQLRALEDDITKLERGPVLLSP